MAGEDLSGANRIIGASLEVSSVKAGYIESFDVVNCAEVSTIQVYATSVDSKFGYTSSLIADELQVNSGIRTIGLTASTVGAMAASVSSISGNNANFTIYDGTLMNTNSLVGQGGFFSTLVTSSLTVQSFEAVSTLSYISTLSSMQVEADVIKVDALFGSTLSTANLNAVVGDFTGVETTNISTTNIYATDVESQFGFISSLSVSSINGNAPLYTLPSKVTFSTVEVADTLSTANLFAGSLGGTIRMGGIPDTPQNITSFATSQTHGAAALGYTINSLGGGNLTLNASNDCLINVAEDFSVTAQDINLTQTGLTSFLNLNATGPVQIGSGLGITMNTTGGGILMTAPLGQINIGGGINTFIEQVTIDDSDITNVSTLAVRNISSLSSINGFPFVPTQNWSSQPALTNVNMSGYDLVNAMTVSTNQIRGQTMTLVGPPGTTSYGVGVIGSTSNLIIGAASTLTLEGNVVEVLALEVSSIKEVNISSIEGDFASFSTVLGETVAFDLAVGINVSSASVLSQSGNISSLTVSSFSLTISLLFSDLQPKNKKMTAKTTILPMLITIIITFTLFFFLF
jgi:hypothetical protein